MIEKIDLSNWKKQKEIILELHREHSINVTPREWRMAVEKNNSKFVNHESKFYITHSNKLGYKATIDYKDAEIGRNDYLKRALTMLKKVRECDLAFQQKRNYRIDFEKGELM